MAASSNIYILLGPELGKKQDFLNSIRSKFPGAEEHIFYTGETAVSLIADAVLNISLFCESKIIIIKNAEMLKKKDEIELLASCIKNMEDNTVLVLLSDEIKLAASLEDIFLQNGIPKNNRQVFYEMFEKEKSEWLMSFFRREGFNIGKECVDAILELVENNTEALKRECSRLINFAKGKTINLSLVEEWLSHNREESAFTLFSRIAAGNLSKALESVSVMLAAKESSQGILAGLAWCFRKLNDYLSLQDTGSDIIIPCFRRRKPYFLQFKTVVFAAGILQ
jgi:DNA polymerase-3 subunit delta